jgi:hypothetical protein
MTSLSEIRARDAEWIVATDSEFAEALHIHPAKPLVWPREMAVADRRHLLALVEELTEKLLQLANECANCDYGKGATTIDMDGNDCQDCADIRGTLAKVQR